MYRHPIKRPKIPRPAIYRTLPSQTNSVRACAVETRSSRRTLRTTPVLYHYRKNPIVWTHCLGKKHNKNPAKSITTPRKNHKKSPTLEPSNPSAGALPGRSPPPPPRRRPAARPGGRGRLGAQRGLGGGGSGGCGAPSGEARLRRFFSRLGCGSKPSWYLFSRVPYQLFFIGFLRVTGVRYLK